MSFLLNSTFGIFSTGSGGGGGGISSADNGLSSDGSTVVLGQDYGAPGDPAALLSNRIIPGNGNNIFLTEDPSNPVLPGLQLNQISISILTEVLPVGELLAFSLSDLTGLGQVGFGLEPNDTNDDLNAVWEFNHTGKTRDTILMYGGEIRIGDVTASGNETYLKIDDINHNVDVVGRGTPVFSISTLDPNDNVGLRFLPTGTGASYVDSNNLGSDIQFRVSNAGALDTNALRIKSNGNVLIGTTSDNGYSLNVAGDVFVQDAGQQVIRMSFSDYGISISDAGFAESLLLNTFPGYSQIQTTSDHPLLLQNEGGNVLIGTSTDNGAKLQVLGGVTTGLLTFDDTGNLPLLTVDRTGSSGKSGYAIAAAGNNVFTMQYDDGTGDVTYDNTGAYNHVFKSGTDIITLDPALGMTINSSSTPVDAYYRIDEWYLAGGSAGVSLRALLTSNMGEGAMNIISGAGTILFQIQKAGITTTDPGGGADIWKLGSIRPGTMTLNTTRYLEVSVGGVICKIATFT